MYKRLIRQAIATGDPARAAKCRGIRREAQRRFSIACPPEEYPTEADIFILINSFSTARIHCIDNIMEVALYGRSQCRKMIDRRLAFVVSYDPVTDPEWPF